MKKLHFVFKCKFVNDLKKKKEGNILLIQLIIQIEIQSK